METVRLTHFSTLCALVGITDYQFLSYHEHAVSVGADSKAISYIELSAPGGKTVFGVGLDHNISLASIKGMYLLLTRAEARKEKESQ